MSIAFLKFYIAADLRKPMCVKDHDEFRRGSKRLTHDKKEDPLEAHFKTSMLFAKSIKSL
jgi:hypothetical protein